MKVKEILKEARKISDTLKDLEQVKAITLFGSVAKNYSDELTKDFDMVAFAKEIPKKEQRQKALEKVVKNWRFYNTRLVQDSFDLNSLKGCTIHWVETEIVERWIRRLKEGPRPYPQMIPHPWLIDFVVYGKVLYDPSDLIRKWKKKLENYPKWLKEKELSILNEIFRFTRSKFIERELRRDNIIFLENKFAQIKNMLIRVVYALNEVYWCMTAEKWSFKEMEDFNFLPSNFIEGLRELSRLSASKVKEKTETIDKIAEKLCKKAREVSEVKIRDEW